jgi:hypothetical protein
MVIGMVVAIASATAMLVVAVSSISRSARLDARRMIEIISLESATLQTAAQLAAGAERPFHPVAEADRKFNNIAIATVISPPEGKFDINADTPQQIAAALQRDGLEGSLVNRTTGAISSKASGPQSFRFGSMHELSRAATLSFGEEDCLRRSLTVGRWPARYFDNGSFRSTASDDDEDEDEPSAIRPGEQIDIRSRLTREDGRDRVLWARIRLTGDFEQPSLSHDWTFLYFKDLADCPVRLPGSGQ